MGRGGYPELQIEFDTSIRNSQGKLSLMKRCPSPRVSYRDGQRRASSRLTLERCDSARAGGDALPVIMSIIRPRRKKQPKLLKLLQRI